MRVKNQFPAGCIRSVWVCVIKWWHYRAKTRFDHCAFWLYTSIDEVTYYSFGASLEEGLAFVSIGAELEQSHRKFDFSVHKNENFNHKFGAVRRRLFSSPDCKSHDTPHNHRFHDPCRCLHPGKSCLTGRGVLQFSGTGRMVLMSR